MLIKILLFALIWVGTVLCTSCGGGNAEGERQILHLNEQMRNHWLALGLEEYSYTLAAGCWDCDERFNVRIKTSLGGEEIFEYPAENFVELENYEIPSLPLTIGGLFDLIDEGELNGVKIKRVNYDEEYGYPTYILVESDDGQITNYAVSQFSQGFSLLDDFYKHYAIWRAMGLTHYTYLNEINCDCASQQSVEVEVLDQKIVSLNDRLNNIPYPSSAVNLDNLKIEALYATLLQAIRDGTLVSVRYNERMGVPREMVIRVFENGEWTNHTTHISALMESDDDRSLSVLNRHKQAWLALQLENYGYHLREGCDCDTFLRVSVQAGVTEAVLRLTDSLNPPSSEVNYLSIESLFARAESAILDGVDVFEIEYDREHFFPKRIYYDPSSDVDGDEVTLTVSLFLVDVPEFEDLFKKQHLWQSSKREFYRYDVQFRLSSEIVLEFMVKVTEPNQWEALNKFTNKLVENSAFYDITIAPWNLFKGFQFRILEATEIYELSYYESGFPQNISVEMSGEIYDLSIMNVENWVHEQREVAIERQAEWQHHQLKNYAYKIEFMCDCSYAGMYFIEVVDGEEIVRRLNTDGESLDVPFVLSELFQVAIDGYNIGYNSVTDIEFDEDYRFVQKLSIGRIANWSTASELTVQITDFQVLTGAQYSNVVVK